VLEGVGYALADGMDVVHACGVKPQSITLIGGGARSAYWRQMLADISGQQLDYRTGGDVGPALGAPGWRSWRSIKRRFFRTAAAAAAGTGPSTGCRACCSLCAAPRNVPADLSAAAAADVVINVRPEWGG
jgi:hypothetical protein